MKILVIHAHPHQQSFNSALCDNVLRGLASGDHDVRIRKLNAENFDPCLSAEEWRAHLDPPETKPQLASHFDDLRWCEALVFVYPTWWGAQPAIIKGWMDRVLAHGVAWDLPDGANRLRPLLHNVRRIVTVTTYGSKWRVNAIQGVPGRRIINRSLRIICHPRCRTKWIAFYGTDSSKARQREVFSQRVETYFSKL